MASARERYDRLLSEEVAPPLKANGFRRSRNRFSRPSNGGWQIIDFQASQYGSAEDVRFTVNLRAAYRELRSRDESWDDKRPPPVYKAHSHERIGTLLPGCEDRWWAFAAGTDASALATELLGVITATALPWLDARASLAEIITLAADHPESLGHGERARLPKLLNDEGRSDLASVFASSGG